MTEKIGNSEIKDLYNANDMALGRVEFLKDGYIINLDNEPLHNETIHGLKPRRWHIYEVIDHKIISLSSLSDKELERLNNFLATKPWKLDENA
jgi:hypothetical protein